MPASPLLENTSESLSPPNSWSTDGAFHCHLAILREGRNYSVIVLNLPGAFGSGDSEEEAVASARNAVVELIAAYRDEGREIPWADSLHKPFPDGAKQKWILVDG